MGRRGPLWVVENMVSEVIVNECKLNIGTIFNVMGYKKAAKKLPLSFNLNFTIVGTYVCCLTYLSVILFLKV